MNKNKVEKIPEYENSDVDDDDDDDDKHERYEYDDNVKSCKIKKKKL